MTVAPNKFWLMTNFPLSIWALAFEILDPSLGDLWHITSGKPRPKKL